jgi:hypothetical protein
MMMINGTLVRIETMGKQWSTMGFGQDTQLADLIEKRENEKNFQDICEMVDIEGELIVVSEEDLIKETNEIHLRKVGKQGR